MHIYSSKLEISEKKARTYKEKKNYKETYLTSGMIGNLMDLKSRIRKWRNVSHIKKTYYKNFR